MLWGCRVVGIPLRPYLLQAIAGPVSCVALPAAIIGLATHYHPPQTWALFVGYGAAYTGLFATCYFYLLKRGRSSGSGFGIPAVGLAWKQNVTAEVPIKRIRVENNSRHHLNVGDVAMLQVAVNRLREVFPEAEITVPSPAPDRLFGLCPDIHVLDISHDPAGLNPSIIPLSLPFAWRLQKEVGSRLDNWFSGFPPGWRVLAELFRTGSPGQRTAIDRLPRRVGLC